MRRAIPVLLAAAALAFAQWVEDSIDVGGGWQGSLAYNPRSSVVYGASEQPGIIFAISCDSSKVVSSLPARWPLHVVYDSIDNKAYCSVYNYEFDSVWVIDGITHQRTKAIPLHWATHLVWDPVGNRLYVSCDEMNRVSVIDCATDSVITHIPTPRGPLRMHLNTRLRKLYVQCHDAESVAIVDLRTNQIRRRIGLPNIPDAGWYSEGAEKYYCGSSGSITVIDGTGDSVCARVGLPGWSQAWSMTENPVQSLLLVGVEDGVSYRAIHVIDELTDSVITVTPILRGPESLWWSSSSGLVYCANFDGYVTVLTGDGSSVLRVLPVAYDPFVFSHSPVRGRLYVGHLGSSKVYVIRDTASAIAEEPVLPEARVPRLSAYPNPSRSRVLVATEEAGPVRVHSADGRLVRVLVPRQGVASWDGTDRSGRALPSGVYCLVSAQGDRAAVVLSR